MKHIKRNDFFSIELPEDFSFGLCLKFLNRNTRECLHRVDGKSLYKAIPLDGKADLFEVSAKDGQLEIRSLSSAHLTIAQQAEVTEYFSELFDLDRDLSGFYQTLAHDPIISPIVNRLKGLRLVRIPDMFEALCWSVIGQQINLKFAYTLKHRLVTHSGMQVWEKDNKYFTFPGPEKILQIPDKLFRQWQFSSAKTKYIKGISREIVEGKLEKQSLRPLSHNEIYERLIALKGIGPWSANYVMMKCFGDASAFPIQDVGLHQALQKQTHSSREYLLEDLIALGKRWHPWQGYATFYLWHTLLDEAVTDQPDKI